MTNNFQGSLNHQKDRLQKKGTLLSEFQKKSIFDRKSLIAGFLLDMNYLINLILFVSDLTMLS